jgi:hypothetical protein
VQGSPEPNVVQGALGIEKKAFFLGQERRLQAG